jgi:hypothetical protein
MAFALLKVASGLFAIAALVCGLVAARYSQRATAITPDPGWSSEPGVESMSQAGWIAATLEALRTGGELNRIGLRWTVAAVLLGTLSSILGVFG